MANFLISAPNEIPLRRKSKLLALLIEIRNILKSFNTSSSLESVLTTLVLTWRIRDVYKIQHGDLDAILQKVSLKERFILKPEVTARFIYTSSHRDELGESCQLITVGKHLRSTTVKA